MNAFQYRKKYALKDMYKNLACNTLLAYILIDSSLCTGCKRNIRVIMHQLSQRVLITLVKLAKINKLYLFI